MVQRTLFAAVTLFFLTMNVLLWRTEVSEKNKTGSPVPLETVWAKIVTAPDRSTLEIRHHNRQIGYCHWSPNVGAELTTGMRMQEGPPPEGMIRNVTGYTIDFDGSVALAQGTNLRFNFTLSLTTNHLWKSFILTLHFRPATYSIQSTAGQDKIILTIEENNQLTQHIITSTDLKNPEQLLGQFGGPFATELLKATGIPLPSSSTNASLGMQWEARQDRMTLGHAKLRVYRLQTSLLHRFQIVALVSPVGEILRIELPDNILFLNEALNL